MRRGLCDATHAAEKVDQFTRLRDEALLANSGKKPEALAKFEAAFSVIPALDVANISRSCDKTSWQRRRKCNNWA